MKYISMITISLTLLLLACASEKKVVSATPEEAMANYDKALTATLKGESLSVIKPFVTKEVFELFSLDKKDKPNKKDEQLERKPFDINCTTTGMEANCIKKTEGSKFDDTFILVKQDDTWLIAGFMGMKITNEFVEARKKIYEKKK